MIDRELLQRIKQTILSVEPGAEIILYGSRARGSSTSESDWDFLILVDGAVDQKRVDRVRHKLYRIEWETGEILSAVVRNRDQWNEFPYRAMPIHDQISTDGIRL